MEEGQFFSFIPYFKSMAVWSCGGWQAASLFKNPAERRNKQKQQASSSLLRGKPLRTNRLLRTLFDPAAFACFGADSLGILADF